MPHQMQVDLCDISDGFATWEDFGMKRKIAVCDDSQVDREFIKGLLNTWADDRQVNIEIQSFVSAEQFLFEYESKKDFDIAILDIEMGKMDGVSLAKKLREENSRIQLLFVTGFPDFMAEGYEVEALHYLMKPVDEEKFFAVMDRALERLSVKEEALLLQVDGETVMLRPSEIFYIEVFSHDCVIHCKDRKVQVKMAISELEETLGEGFIRVHRSYLVNIGRIARISKTEVFLEEGLNVPISRRSYAEVNKAFIKYYRRGEK